MLNQPGSKVKIKNYANRVAKNSELKGAHFEIFQGFSSNFAKNVRFLYYREANKKRHVPLKVAPMCSKVHGFSHPACNPVLDTVAHNKF